MWVHPGAPGPCPGGGGRQGTGPPGLMMGGAPAGLAANAVARAILSHAHKSLNIRGARMHIIGDSPSSCGVVLAALMIALTGWERADPIVAGAIAIVIVVGA